MELVDIHVQSSNSHLLVVQTAKFLISEGYLPDNVIIGATVGDSITLPLTEYLSNWDSARHLLQITDYDALSESKLPPITR